MVVYSYVGMDAGSGLTFVETTVFTKRVMALGLEDSLRMLQQELLTNPEAGDVEPGTGGLRKIRMRDPGRERQAWRRPRALPVAQTQGPHLSDLCVREARILEADGGTEAPVATDRHTDQRNSVR